VDRHDRDAHRRVHLAATVPAVAAGRSGRGGRPVREGPLAEAAVRGLARLEAAQLPAGEALGVEEAGAGAGGEEAAAGVEADPAAGVLWVGGALGVRCGLVVINLLEQSVVAQTNLAGGGGSWCAKQLHHTCDQSSPPYGGRPSHSSVLTCCASSIADGSSY